MTTPEKRNMRLDKLSNAKKQILKARIEEAGGVVGFSNETGINRGLVSMAYSGDFLSPQIVRVLELREPYPKYFKCRPDDITQVQRQLEKHYPGYELVRKEK